jgi:hypothetical protein
MEKTSSENDQVAMMGDFNVDQHKDDRMKKIMNNYKFNQLIKASFLKWYVFVDKLKKFIFER